MTPVALAVATALGVGRVPFAPGTFGSVVGLLLWFAASGSLPAQAIVLGLVAVAGVWSAGVAEAHYHATDPGAVVIDEVLGMLLTLFLIPVGWLEAAGGFVLFRLFDIVKPYPANRVERLPGGLGIMGDDAVAGLYANIVLRVLLAVVQRAA
jgi:phosphatidylglycerophosphatase A